MPAPQAGENNGYERGYGQNQVREFEQGQGQDHHEDGDYEDEGLNDDTDGDVLSGPEDQSERRRRQHRRPDGDNGGVFTPTRSAPQPPSLNGALDPKSREAEIAHIMYIQQQQALFLQEKAMNPPLKQKSSNGNLSGNGSDHSKPRRKGSRHRKQISVISVPKLVSTTNQIKTVPIVRPADQSDNDDAGTKSEYTSGGEGIKKTVRKMRRAVRHAANGAFNNDDSDREDNLGSKSDAEKKGGLKQLKALKSKIAKKLHRPSHGGQSSSREHGQEHHQGAYGEEGNRAPVQFFSEENLRSRYLAQEQHQGFSLGAAGASLRRSNTTRDAVGPGPMLRRRDPDFMDGDKQELDSQNEDEEDAPLDAQQQEAKAEAEAKAKKAKIGSRTFDKDEMIEVKDGTGESFFVPRWDFDPRADELDSSKSVISVQSSKKLERSASGSTTASTKNKPAASIAERLQGSTVKEEGGDLEQPSTATDVSTPSSSVKIHSQDGVTDEHGQTKEDLTAKQEQESQPLDGAHEIASESTSASASASSNSGLNSRASVISGSSDVSSVGGIVVAQVLTRQNSMKRNFKRQGSNEESKVQTQVQSPMPLPENEQPVQADSPHFGLGIFMPSLPTKEQEQDSQLDAVMAGFNSGKELPPLPREGTLTAVIGQPDTNIWHRVSC